ncbi:hypothetical protein [Natronobacterium texcoconense]|uniref:hypothetical protein n=1 Tax=Natronobacterium texcoconense TaxID=1095778 RepID=UPI000B8095C7|nr:hypothetical protein [Natronobacterium texcoconense]
MDENGEKRRAPVQCTNCGTIGIVRISADETYTPIGQSTICDCDGGTLRVLDEEIDDGFPDETVR